MDTILERIAGTGLVPVIKLDNAKDAVPLAKALAAGDIPVAEVTFRTAAAEESIRRISTELPDVLVGAGTVLSVEQVKQAVNAGARFIVSPGFNPRVAEYCTGEGIPITPGINNPSVLEAALEMGIRVLKYFPAEQSGGLAMLKAMAAPYGDVRFVPTGGITKDTMGPYLAWDRVLAVGGSWMAPSELISAGKFDEITRLAAASIARVHDFELLHLGINERDEQNATDTVSLLERLFHMPAKAGNSSIFAGKAFEVMKHPYLGNHGHVGLSANSVERAVAYLATKGIGTKPETAKFEGGVLKVIYLDLEIAGFAFHISRK
jgi:2-dehydro-3-deoxyphosphogluconate aldolase/(4S)-4-hydroxy-2-oxoglutarate aldolase